MTDASGRDRRSGRTSWVVMVGTALFLTLAGCAAESGSAKSDAEQPLEGGRPVRAEYSIRTDESRTAKVELSIQVRPTSSVAEADAGEADLAIESSGTVTFTNQSEDRAIEEGALDHELSLKLPFKACVLSPTFASTAEDFDLTEDVLCNYNILKVLGPELEPGESKTVSLQDMISGDGDIVVADATSVPEPDAGAWVDAASAAAVVAGADERFSLADAALNPVCTYRGSSGDPVARATFWSSDRNVDECSTEPVRLS